MAIVEFFHRSHLPVLAHSKWESYSIWKGFSTRRCLKLHDFMQYLRGFSLRYFQFPLLTHVSLCSTPLWSLWSPLNYECAIKIKLLEGIACSIAVRASNSGSKCLVFKYCSNQWNPFLLEAFVSLAIQCLRCEYCSQVRRSDEWAKIKHFEVRPEVPPWKHFR